MATPRPSFRRALLVVNPGSGREAEVRETVEALRQAHLEVDEGMVERSPAISEIIRARGREADVVIVGGGDGTVSVALSAVLAVGRPLAVLPLGTANDFARGLELPADPVAAGMLVVRGRIRRVDVGRVDGRLFANDLSVGLGARVGERTTQASKRRGGVLGYAIQAVRELRSEAAFRATIECDGDVRESECVQITVANGPTQGGGLVRVGNARLDDGFLDVLVMEPRSLWDYARLLPVLPSGRPGGPLAWMRGRRIRIETDRRLPVYADGDPASHTPVTVEVVPRALPVVVPVEQERSEKLDR